MICPCTPSPPRRRCRWATPARTGGCARAESRGRGCCSIPSRRTGLGALGLDHLLAAYGHRPHQHWLAATRAPEEVGDDEMDALLVALLLVCLFQTANIPHNRPASKGLRPLAKAAERLTAWVGNPAACGGLKPFSVRIATTAQTSIVRKSMPSSALRANGATCGLFRMWAFMVELLRGGMAVRRPHALA